MAKKKKSVVLPDNIVAAQKKLDSLVDEKYALLQSLSKIHNHFNSLVDNDVKNMDEWLYSLPIETASALGDKNRISRLGKVKIRQSLKKDSERVLDKLDYLEVEIKIAYLDLISERIHSALEIHKG